MIVLSVSQTYWNRGVSAHRKRAKRIWQAYLIDDDGKLHTKRVNWARAMYLKTQIRRKRKMFCQNCQEVYIGFVKNYKEILKIECPTCEDSDMIPADSLEQFEK